MGFIGMLGAAAYGFSFVPFVGGYIEDLIGMLAKFSLLVFFVLNSASLLLISFEKRIYSLLNRDLSDLVLLDIKDATNVQNTIIENIQSESLLESHQKESLES
jgi:hypothetical protein